MADISRLAVFSPSQHQSRSPSRPPRPHSSGVDSATANAKSHRCSLPFVIPPPRSKNTSSTFLIPSTAKGRPVPLEDSTTAHCTTALRQLNRSQPSPRHRYTRSSEPSNLNNTTTETYSQPVVVRTYSGLPPTSSTKRPVSVSTAPPLSSPTAQDPSRNITARNMTLNNGYDKPRLATDAKLPPLESFSFKNIMADIKQDVGADLDRIAEICARSRYSLSNQYEVHIAPQGSGSGFIKLPVASSSLISVPVGPTLQAIPSDDEHIGSAPKKRKSMARRRSVAYGTLKTIMSSSRSSDEDTCKKRSAAEIVKEVRGRAAEMVERNGVGRNNEAPTGNEQQEVHRGELLPTPALFTTAIIDSSRTHVRSGGSVAPLVTTGDVLLGGPAKPQNSRNYLQTTTLPEEFWIKYHMQESLRPSQAIAQESVTAATFATPKDQKTFSTLTQWIPWKRSSMSEIKRIDTRSHPSYAESKLKELVKRKIPLSC
ncbi:hypothetical protein GGR53DRAFT_30384 [Hypoxylon sp. FL1150]|nr:hypothetical protein GGR53DRAFT_30384 [Hypoxylon sp. FL1150]